MISGKKSAYHLNPIDMHIMYSFVHIPILDSVFLNHNFKFHKIYKLCLRYFALLLHVVVNVHT